MQSHKIQRLRVAELPGMFTKGQMLIRTQRAEEAQVTRVSELNQSLQMQIYNLFIEQMQPFF